MHTADSVKMLDMSMPKYDEVKSYKASVETVKSLYVEPTQSGNVGIPASQLKKKGGLPASNVVPATEKKSEEKKKEKKMEYIF
jgi:hypothetical protein